MRNYARFTNTKIQFLYFKTTKYCKEVKPFMDDFVQSINSVAIYAASGIWPRQQAASIFPGPLRLQLMSRRV